MCGSKKCRRKCSTSRKCYDDDDISANDAVIGGIERPRLLTEVEEYIVTYNARLSPDRVYLNVIE